MYSQVLQDLWVFCCRGSCARGKRSSALDAKTHCCALAAMLATLSSRPALHAQALFLAGGFQMLAAEVTMAALLGVFFHGAVGDHVPADVGVGILVVVCVFVAGFAYSWGPLGWLVRAR